MATHRNIAGWRGTDLVDRDGGRSGSWKTSTATVETDEPISDLLPPLPAQLHTAGGRKRPEARAVMRRHSTAHESGTSPSEAERLRRARLSVWEYEGGGLGPFGPPPGRPES